MYEYYKDTFRNGLLAVVLRLVVLLMRSVLSVDITSQNSSSYLELSRAWR